MTLCDGDTGAKWDERPPSPLLAAGLAASSSFVLSSGCIVRDASTVLALSHSDFQYFFFSF